MSTTPELSTEERATLLRLAIAPRHWVRLDRRNADTVAELKAAGLIDVIEAEGRRYAGIRDDAGVVLNALLPDAPPSDANPAETRNWATYRRAAKKVGLIP